MVAEVHCSDHCVVDGWMLWRNSNNIRAGECNWTVCQDNQSGHLQRDGSCGDMAISSGLTVLAGRKQDWGCCDLALMDHRMRKKKEIRRTTFIIVNLHFIY